MTKLVSADRFKHPIKGGSAAISRLDSLACGVYGLSWAQVLRVAEQFLGRRITNVHDMTQQEVIYLTKHIRTHGELAVQARKRMWESKGI